VTDRVLERLREGLAGFLESAEEDEVPGAVVEKARQMQFEYGWREPDDVDVVVMAALLQTLGGVPEAPGPQLKDQCAAKRFSK
jgi:hypothetical protein